MVCLLRKENQLEQVQICSQLESILTFSRKCLFYQIFILPNFTLLDRSPEPSELYAKLLYSWYFSIFSLLQLWGLFLPLFWNVYYLFVNIMLRLAQVNSQWTQWTMNSERWTIINEQWLRLKICTYLWNAQSVQFLTP